MKFLIYFFAMIIFTGCITKQSFPESWDNIEKKDNTCTDISGVYGNKGLIVDSPYIPLLSHILLDTSKNITSLKLLLSKETLLIKGYSKDKLITTNKISLDEKTFYCKENFWTLELDDSINNGGALAKQWDTYYLSKTSEGLVIKKKSTATGIMFLIPIVGSDTSWILFKNLHKN